MHVCRWDNTEKMTEPKDRALGNTHRKVQGDKEDGGEW